MLITNVDSDGNPSAHGIQCGMARMSMVASTGSPSQPRLRMSFAARTDWSNRMFWLTASAMPASAHKSTSSRATSSDIASGFCARMPRSRPLPHSTARRIRSGCASGGTATSRISMLSSASNSSMLS